MHGEASLPMKRGAWHYGWGGVSVLDRMTTARLVGCVVLVAAASGCARRAPDVVCFGPYEYKVHVSEGGWYVLRWQATAAQVGGDKAELEWHCYVLDDPVGRCAIRHWIGMNAQSLYRPRAYDPMHITPTVQMAWFWDGEIQEKWDLWRWAPSLAPTWSPRPKLAVLTGRWIENLPAPEIERLKQVFRKHGQPADPDRADVRAALGPAQPVRTSPFSGGTYVLYLGDEDERGALCGWTSYALDETAAGHGLVEKWVAAHYEALKCAVIKPDQAVIPDKYIVWSNGQCRVCVPLLQWFPVAPWGMGSHVQAVRVFGRNEIEELELLLRTHGRKQEPDAGRAADLSPLGW